MSENDSAIAAFHTPELNAQDASTTNKSTNQSTDGRSPLPLSALPPIPSTNQSTDGPTKAEVVYSQSGSLMSSTNQYPYHPVNPAHAAQFGASMFSSLVTPAVAAAIHVAPLGDPIPPDTAAWAAIEEKFAPKAGETPEERRVRLKARKRERENQRRRERRAEARRRRDEGRRAAEALGLTAPAQIKAFLEARERQYHSQQLMYAAAVPVTHAHIIANSSYPPGSYHAPINQQINPAHAYPPPPAARPATADASTSVYESSLNASINASKTELDNVNATAQSIPTMPSLPSIPSLPSHASTSNAANSSSNHQSNHQTNQQHH